MKELARMGKGVLRRTSFYCNIIEDTEKEKDVADAHAMAAEGAWMTLPLEQTADALVRLLDAAEKIRSDSEVCVVVDRDSRGIQGILELLQGRDRNLRKTPRIFFAGNTLSTRRWQELLELLEGRDFSIIAISHGGEPLEPALALRELRWILGRKYGTDEASNRIYAIVENEQSTLGRMAAEEQWQTFRIPEGLAQGFDLLTPAGLLPLAVAGVDIQALLKGAETARGECGLRSFENPLWLYAGVRYALSRQGKNLELMGSFEPGFRAFGDWWRQCFAACGGIVPAVAELTADLPGVEQLIRQGHQNLFETMVRFYPPETGSVISIDWKNLDGLGYLEDRTLGYVEEQAFEAAASAHADGGAAVITMDCGPLGEDAVGALVFFLALACVLCGNLQGAEEAVPPGEAWYQQNLCRLLGKPAEE